MSLFVYNTPVTRTCPLTNQNMSHLSSHPFFLCVCFVLSGKPKEQGSRTTVYKRLVDMKYGLKVMLLHDMTTTTTITITTNITTTTTNTEIAASVA